jgi:hypothetical protein
MKIVQQTQDVMVLTEGNMTSIMIGSALALVGVVVAITTSGPGFIIGAILIITGVGVALLSSAITVTINKTGGQLLYQKKRLVGAQTTTYATADINRIETRKQWETTTTSNGTNRGLSSQQRLVSQSVIVCKDGTELPVDHQKSSSGMTLGVGVLLGGSGAEGATAKQVADFLGVPFQEVAPPAEMGVGMGAGGIQL